MAANDRALTVDLTTKLPPSSVLSVWDARWSGGTGGSGGGSNLSRATKRLQSGESVKFSVIGDSIADPSTEGNSAGGPVEKAAALLSSRFGVTVSVGNHAKSGYTAARAYITGEVTGAINEQADVLFIFLGKNDIGSDIGGQYAPGYPLTASIASVERMLAAARRDNDKADLVVIGEGPYTAGSSSNAALQTWQNAARRVAAAWGAEFIDVYKAFVDYGDYSGLMFDSTHQNSAGNDLYASTIAARFPASFSGAAVAPAPFGRGIYDVSRVSLIPALNYGYAVNAGASGVTAQGLTITESGTGWASQATSNTGDYLQVTGPALEFLLQVSTAAADAAVVDVSIDGTTTQTNLNLSTQGKQGTYIVAFALGLSVGVHTIRLTLKSGTLRRYAMAALTPGTTAFIPETQVIDFGNSGTTVTVTPVGDPTHGVSTPGPYASLVNGALQMPDGWKGMSVEFQGFASLRVTGATTATTTPRLVQVQAQLGSTVIAAPQYTFQPTSADTYFPLFITQTLAITATNSQGMLFRVRTLSTDKTQVLVAGAPAWSFKAILTRTA